MCDKKCSVCEGMGKLPCLMVALGDRTEPGRCAPLSRSSSAHARTAMGFLEGRFFVIPTKIPDVDQVKDWVVQGGECWGVRGAGRTYDGWRRWNIGGPRRRTGYDRTHGLDQSYANPSLSTGR